uniref:BHLH domain-containing protein n=1 Tax=Eptatretus burgeri TaxID=7764 RepID=A0A8C4RBG0_EPTBU
MENKLMMQMLWEDYDGSPSSSPVLPLEEFPGMGTSSCNSEQNNTEHESVIPQDLPKLKRHHHACCRCGLPTGGHPITLTSGKVAVTLVNHRFWAMFHINGTEMLVARSGRRMFPYCQFDIDGLDPNLDYIMALDMVPMDSHHNQRFDACFPVVHSMSECPDQLYLHPESPSLGLHWMKRNISFCKVKLTNHYILKNEYLFLSAKHNYAPRLHVIQSDVVPSTITHKENYFIFPQTEFTAVTSYQNTLMTELKLGHNLDMKGPKQSNYLQELQRKSSINSTGSGTDESSIKSIFANSKNYLSGSLSQENLLAALLPGKGVDEIAFSDEKTKEDNDNENNSHIDVKEMMQHEVDEDGSNFDDLHESGKRVTEISQFDNSVKVIAQEQSDHHTALSSDFEDAPSMNDAFTKMDLSKGKPFVLLQHCPFLEGLVSSMSLPECTADMDSDGGKIISVHAVGSKVRNGKATPTCNKTNIKGVAMDNKHQEKLPSESSNLSKLVEQQPFVSLELCSVTCPTVKVSELPTTMLTSARTSYTAVDCSNDHSHFAPSYVEDSGVGFTKPLQKSCTPDVESCQEMMTLQSPQCIQASEWTPPCDIGQSLVHSQIPGAIVSGSASVLPALLLGNTVSSAGVWTPPTIQYENRFTELVLSPAPIPSATSSTCTSRSPSPLTSPSASPRISKVSPDSGIKTSISHAKITSPVTSEEMEMDLIDGVAFFSFQSKEALVNHKDFTKPDHESSTPSTNRQLNTSRLPHDLSRGRLKQLREKLKEALSTIQKSKALRNESTGLSSQFISRTGKTNDVTKIKGWQQKFRQQPDLPQIASCGAATSVASRASEEKPSEIKEPSMACPAKNRAVFMSEELDEYLQAEEKLLEQRPTLYASHPTDIVLPTPCTNSTYVRTFDSITRLRATSSPATNADLPSPLTSPSKPTETALTPVTPLRRTRKRPCRLAPKARRSIPRKLVSHQARLYRKAGSLRYTRGCLQALEDVAFQEGKERTYITKARAEEAVRLLTLHQILPSSLRSLECKDGSSKTSSVNSSLPKNAYCSKEHCSHGCVCFSLDQGHKVPMHCQRAEGMLDGEFKDRKVSSPLRIPPNRVEQQRCTVKQEAPDTLLSTNNKRRKAIKRNVKNIIFYDALDDKCRIPLKTSFRKNELKQGRGKQKRGRPSKCQTSRTNTTVKSAQVIRPTSNPEVEKFQPKDSSFASGLSVPEEKSFLFSGNTAREKCSPSITLHQKGGVSSPLESCARIRQHTSNWKPALKAPYHCPRKFSTSVELEEGEVSDEYVSKKIKLEKEDPDDDYFRNDWSDSNFDYDSTLSRNDISSPMNSNMDGHFTVPVGGRLEVPQLKMPERSSTQAAAIGSQTPKAVVKQNSSSLSASSKLIEIVADCSWEKERDKILNAIASYTGQQRLSGNAVNHSPALLRVGSFLLEISHSTNKTPMTPVIHTGTPSSGTVAPTPPRGHLPHHICSSKVRITRQPLETVIMQPDVHKDPVKQSQKRVTQPLLPVKLKTNAGSNIHSMTSMGTSGNNIHVAPSSTIKGLIQVNGNNIANAKLVVGQMGALHPILHERRTSEVSISCAQTLESQYDDQLTKILPSFSEACKVGNPESNFEEVITKEHKCISPTVAACPEKTLPRPVIPMSLPMEENTGEMTDMTYAAGSHGNIVKNLDPGQMTSNFELSPAVSNLVTYPDFSSTAFMQTKATNHSVVEGEQLSKDGGILHGNNNEKQIEHGSTDLSGILPNGDDITLESKDDVNDGVCIYEQNLGIDLTALPCDIQVEMSLLEGVDIETKQDLVNTKNSLHSDVSNDGPEPNCGTPFLCGSESTMTSKFKGTNTMDSSASSRMSMDEEPSLYDEDSHADWNSSMQPSEEDDYLDDESAVDIETISDENKLASNVINKKRSRWNQFSPVLKSKFQEYSSSSDQDASMGENSCNLKFERDDSASFWHNEKERRRRSTIRSLLDAIKRELGIDPHIKKPKHLILQMARDEIEQLNNENSHLIARKKILLRRRNALLRKAALLSGHFDSVILKNVQLQCDNQGIVHSQQNAKPQTNHSNELAPLNDAFPENLEDVLIKYPQDQFTSSDCVSKNPYKVPQDPDMKTSTICEYQETSIRDSVADIEVVVPQLSPLHTAHAKESSKVKPKHSMRQRRASWKMRESFATYPWFQKNYYRPFNSIRQLLAKRKDREKFASKEEPFEVVDMKLKHVANDGYTIKAAQNEEELVMEEANWGTDASSVLYLSQVKTHNSYDVIDSSEIVQEAGVLEQKEAKTDAESTQVDFTELCLSEGSQAENEFEGQGQTDLEDSDFKLYLQEESASEERFDDDGGKPVTSNFVGKADKEIEFWNMDVEASSDNIIVPKKGMMDSRADIVSELSKEELLQPTENPRCLEESILYKDQVNVTSLTENGADIAEDLKDKLHLAKEEVGQVGRSSLLFNKCISNIEKVSTETVTLHTEGFKMILKPENEGLTQQSKDGFVAQACEMYNSGRMSPTVLTANELQKQMLQQMKIVKQKKQQYKSQLQFLPQPASQLSREKSSSTQPEYPASMPRLQPLVQKMPNEHCLKEGVSLMNNHKDGGLPFTSLPLGQDGHDNCSSNMSHQPRILSYQKILPKADGSCVVEKRVDNTSKLLLPLSGPFLV